MNRVPLHAAPAAGLALALLVAGCADAVGDRALARHELLARSMMAAWESGDPERLAESFWPDAIYDDFSSASTWQGIEEIVDYKLELHRWGEGVTVDAVAVHPSPTGVTVEWVVAAIQSAPVAGLTDSVTGREVVLNGVTILEVEGDRVARAADYVDALPLVLQLGGRVEMPGGEVRELDGGPEG